MNKKSPKIVIIGAGSLFFGRQAIWSLTNLPGYSNATLSLVDTDAVKLELMLALARKAVASRGLSIRVEGSVNYREALPGADFVVLSFSKDNAYYRRIDCQVSAKYGIRMCSGDTIGPGGVFRTMREFPAILEIAREVERVCPEAWLINYINPSAIMGIGLMRHSRVKSFALCDSHHLPRKKESYLKLLGPDMADLDRLDLRIAGVNHFTWMLKAEYDGKDVLPVLRNAFHAASAKETDQGYSKGRFNATITAQLYDVFGALPTCTGHTKEYLPYYQGRSAICEPIPPLSVFDCDERDQRTSKMWEDVEAYVRGEKTMDDFHASYRSDHATDIMHTMLTGDGRTYFINRLNSECVGSGGKAVENLPEDAFLEMECKLDENGPKPLPVGAFPMGLRALQMLILDVHELTVEAIVKRDKTLLVRALAMDPLVNSIATAKAVIDELFAAQSEILGDWNVPETDSKPGVAGHGQATRVEALPQLF